MGWIIDILKDVPLSAVIREQLLLAEKKIALLESENTNLQSQINELRKKIQRRDNIIQKEKSHGTLLDKEMTAILMLISDWQGEPFTSQIAERLNISERMAKYRLGELQKNKFIREGLPVLAGVKSWILEPDGTKYLIENKIVT